MGNRYYVEHEIVGERVTLSGAEATHLIKAMRASVGDEVTLFDGRGAEFLARIEAIEKKQVVCELLERREPMRELPLQLWLAAALPKGDRQRMLVEKSVELGVTRFIPLETHRQVAKATPNARERLQRQVIEASKQCGRNHLMEIAEPTPLADLVSQHVADSIVWLAHPSGGELAEAKRGDSEHSRVIVLVGPEGGFTDEEVEMARSAGCKVVALGPRILRVETAALALATIWSVSR